MKRWDIINQFITDRHYSSFLEIGTASGETFRRINAEHKVSVDPNKNTDATYKVTSDEYFKSRRNRDKFDIIFIDGLHEHNQVWRDIQNSLKHLNQNGVIVLHDCHPTDKHMQEPYSNQQFWTGDVWKAFVKARAELDYACYVIDTDFGCGVIDTAYKAERDKPELPTDMESMTYDEFVNHPEWMGFRK